MLPLQLFRAILVCHLNVPGDTIVRHGGDVLWSSCTLRFPCIAINSSTSQSILPVGSKLNWISPTVYAASISMMPFAYQSNLLFPPFDFLPSDVSPELRFPVRFSSRILACACAQCACAEECVSFNVEHNATIMFRVI